MKEPKDFNWTPELAYIVGLITTDGCLSSKRGHISFVSKDIDLIRTFIKILKLKNKIGFTRNAKSWAYKVQFGNIQFYGWLQRIGLTPRKSKTLGPIKIPDEYFRDFLRGHLDGDGSITTYSDKYNVYKSPKYVYQRLFIRFISASERHVLWLQGKISSVLGIKGAFHKTKIVEKTGNRMYVVKFAKKNSLKLLRKIYYAKGLPSLTRKRIQAEQCLSSPLLLPKNNKSSIVRL